MCGQTVSTCGESGLSTFADSWKTQVSSWTLSPYATERRRMSSFVVNIILPFLCIHLTWESNNYHQMSLWFVSYNCSWSYCMFSFGSSYLWYLSNIIHLCTVDIPVYILQYQFQTITSFTITVYRKIFASIWFLPFLPSLSLGKFKTGWIQTILWLLQLTFNSGISLDNYIVI